MINSLIVVTCYKDVWQFLLQCKSFDKFLEPCEIFIVINERNPSAWLVWFENKCKQYLHRFKYTIHTRQDFNLPELGQDGYADQQAIKLLLSEILLNKTYYVFDTKNWLIKSMSVSEIPHHHRHDNLKTKNMFSKFFTECVNHFGNYQIQNTETPYILNSEIVHKLFSYFGGRTKFLEWFLNSNIKNPSEFLVYDMFAQCNSLAEMSIATPPIHKTFWHGSKITDNDIEKVFNSEIKILAIQRSLLPQINIKKLEDFYEN